MKAKIKAFFTRNIALKIISLVLGLGLWVLFSNIQDPAITRVVNVPIVYTNADLLASQDHAIMLSGPEYVQINVTVHTSKQSQVNYSMFRCTADLTDRSGGDLSNQRVHVNVTQVGGTNLILDWSYSRNDPNIVVVMDEIIEREFTVELLATDRLTEGLVLAGSVSFRPETVTVSGPLSRFGRVASVKAQVSLSEFTDGNGGTFTEEVPIYLFDGNDKILTDSQITLSQDTVTMTAIVSRVKTSQVKLLGTTGKVAQGYRYVSSEVSPETVSVYGLKGTVADLSEIYIPDTAVDITGLTGDEEYELNIEDYLPEGVKLLDGTNGTITVKVFVEALVTQSYPIYLYDMDIIGKASDMEYTIDTTGLRLVVSGLEEDMKVFKLSNVRPVLDLTDYEPGTYRVPVTILKLAGYEFPNVDDLSVPVEIRLNRTEEPTEEGPEEADL